MLRRLVLVLALASAVTACKKKQEPAAGAASAARAKVALPVFLDDRQVAADAELGPGPRPLTELVPGAPPLDGWIAIELQEAAGPVRAVMRPAAYKPGLVPALAATGGAVSFGWVKPGAGALEEPVAIQRIKVQTRAPAPGAAEAGHEHDHGSGDSGGGGGGQGDGARPVPTAELQIVVETGKGEATFTGDKLVPLPTVHAPIGDTETPGWSFTDVMKAAGIGDAKAVQLTDSEGASLKLEGVDFDPAQTLLYLKLNKSGVIRFRVFRKKADTWEVGGELRGVSRIKVM